MNVNKRIAGMESRVRESFGARPYPGDDNLVIAEALVDGDARDLLDAIKGRTWQEAAPSILTKNLAHSIYYFTPAGYKYYLPAYLIYLLRWKGCNALGDKILSSLEPSQGGDSWFNERFNGLSDRERQAIADVVKLVYEVNDYDEEDELPQYWKKFGSN